MSRHAKDNHKARADKLNDALPNSSFSFVGRTLSSSFYKYLSIMEMKYKMWRWEVLEFN